MISISYDTILGLLIFALFGVALFVSARLISNKIISTFLFIAFFGILVRFFGVVIDEVEQEYKDKVGVCYQEVNSLKKLNKEYIKYIVNSLIVYQCVKKDIDDKDECHKALNYVISFNDELLSKMKKNKFEDSIEK